MLDYPCVPQDDYSDGENIAALAILVFTLVFCYFEYTSYNDGYINQSESSITAKETSWHAPKATSHQKKLTQSIHQKTRLHHQKAVKSYE